MEDKWITVQIAPVATPGLMARNMPVVAFLLQHKDGDPTETRAVAAALTESALVSVEGMPSGYEGEWRKVVD